MKYKIKNHIIDAKSPVEALKIHKLFSQCKDSVRDAYLLQLKNDRDVYWQEDDHFGRSKRYAKRFNTYEEAKTKANVVVSDWPRFVNIIKDSVRDNYTKDEAYDRSTIEALISDEKAAIDAYNVAIANLEGKISDLGIKVLQGIRDDEQKHVENLYSILSNNISEKNLKDSKIKDSSHLTKASQLKVGAYVGQPGLGVYRWYKILNVSNDSVTLNGEGFMTRSGNFWGNSLGHIYDEKRTYKISELLNSGEDLRIE